MFSKLMVPVDLGNRQSVERALDAAGALAKLWSAEVVYVGVTATAPGPVARSPEDFAQKLEAFADEEGKRHGVETSALALKSHDPTADLDRHLSEAVSRSGADLVVMATHHPDISDNIWSGHGSHLASHSDASVMLVR